MTILQITGKADKRMITYPFMKICALAGKTTIITDDITYRRLYEGHEDVGYIDNVEINIVRDLSGSDAVTSAKMYEMQKEKEEFDYLVYITDYFISEGAEAVIGMCEQNKTFEGWTLEELYEHTSKITPCLLSMGKNEQSRWEKMNLEQISWEIKYFDYILETERKRKLMPLKDKSIIHLLSKAFCNSLKLTPNNFQKIAGRKI